ncbi:MAG: TlpA family protein disulfide reductase [Saprospiraceae bacterium]
MILTDKGEDYYGSESIPLISGQVASPTATELTLRTYRDYITFQEDVYTAKLHRDGSFSFLNVKIERPTVGLLTYNGERVEIYLEPDNQLFVTFDGRQFLPTLAFSGTGSAHNNYLTKSLQQFYKNSTESLNYEMTQRGATDFRDYLDGLRAEKLAFYQQEVAQYADDYSSNFQAFAQSDIDYWWAYHLMRYRHEYPAAQGIPAPMTLPTPYYNFLDSIQISNDDALLNKYYIHFLDAFFNFVKENPTELCERENLDHLRKVKNNTYGLIAGPFNYPVIVPIQEGVKVQVTANPAAEWQPTLYQDSLHVWLAKTDLKPYDVEQEEINVVNTRTVEHIRSRVELYGVVRFEQLEVRKDPYQKPFFVKLNEGDKVDLAYNRTKERISYKLAETTYSDYFIKIRLADGQEGWVLQGAIDTKERIEEVRETEEIAVSIAPKTYNNARKYLDQEVLNYVLAKDIYQRAGETSTTQLRKEIEDLLTLSNSERYNIIAKSAYDRAVNGTHARPKTVALKQMDSDVNVASLAFSESFAEYLPEVKEQPSRMNLVKKANRPVFNPSEYAEIELPKTNNQAQLVNIKGEIPVRSRTKLELIIYLDPIVYQEANYLLKPNKEGIFAAQFELTEPVTGELRYGEQILPVYLEPGDELSLSFDPQQFEQTLKFSGQGAANNNYLKENRVALRKIQKDVNTNVRYVSPTAYRQFMDKARGQRNDFFTNHAAQEAFSKSFRAFAQADIDYWYGFYLLNYAWEHPLYNDQPAPMTMPADYYDFTQQLPLNKNGILTNKYYTFYVDQYLAYELEQADNQGVGDLEIAKKLLKEEPLFYYQTKLLVASCRRGQSREAGWVIQDFVKNCPYSTFNQVLSDTYHRSRGLLEGTNAPDFTLADADGNSVGLSDYKGKVVFIDFWATWCAPCLRYMRNTQRMTQQFADDDVVFLYISLDRNKEVWERHIAAKKLHGTHLTAGNGSGYQSHIAQLYRVKQLPTYVLIDRDGKVAISPENMPNTAELTGAISRLLTQN